MQVHVDFHAVAIEHHAIHERLQNWARWCYSNGGRTVAPMFRLYRSSEQWNHSHIVDGVDSLDAQKVQKGVSMLPEHNRKALAWCYVLRTSPKRAARDLAVTMDGLMVLVTNGRAMLVNRRV